jgi:hypothetical protein
MKRKVDMFICYNCEKLMKNRTAYSIPRLNGGVNYLCSNCYKLKQKVGK